MIYLIFMSLSVILFINCMFFERDFTAPSVLYIGGFWATSFLAAIFNDTWMGFHSLELYLLIVGGALFFCIGCILGRCIIHRRGLTVNKLMPIRISKSKIIIMMMLQIVVAFASYWVVRKNTQSADYIMAIGEFYLINKIGEADIPGWFKILQYFNMSAVYWGIYIAMNNIVCNYKNVLLLKSSIFLGLLVTLMQGTRNALFMFLISAVIIYLMLCNIKNAWTPNINYTTCKRLIILGVIIVLLFQGTFYVTGRDDINYDFIDIVSSYIGAPIKNLDWFLLENHLSGHLFGEQTFLQWYNKIYNFTHNPFFITKALYEYRWLNNMGLGNVYTIYMPLYNDFGVVGAWTVVCILGCSLQYYYSYIKYSVCNIKKIDLHIIIYSYIGFSSFFSFFSNKFFEMTISVVFIYVFIWLWGIKKFLFKRNG